MANLKSSKKDIRRIAKRTEANKSVKTSLKTYIKKVRLAIIKGDKDELQVSVNQATKSLDKAVQRGIIHKNQAARRKSRIALAANKLAEAGAPAAGAK